MNERQEVARSRICVATFAFGHIPYLPYTQRINHAYCRTHGYPFKMFGLDESFDRHPNWGKVKGVAALLDETDFLFFLDADAYFLDHNRSLEMFIKDHMSTASFLAAVDRKDQRTGWSDWHANSGVFVVRNSPVGRQMLDAWWNAPSQYDRRWLWTWPLEQAALNYVVRQLFTEFELKVIPYHFMNGRDGTFVRHLAGMPDHERVAILQAEAERYPDT